MFPCTNSGVQFVPIDGDPAASEALKELDDQLGPDHGVRVSDRNKSLP
jgi:hypothetical protein